MGRVDRAVSLRLRVTLLLAVVLGGWAASAGLNAYLDQRVRVGGTVFEELARDRELLESIALQKADLNQVRAELGALIGEEQGPDAIGATRERIERLHREMDLRFDSLRGVKLTAELRSALDDAHAAWTESFVAVDKTIIPAVEIGRRAMAREIVGGQQKRRYEGISRDLAAIGDQVRAETLDHEGAAVTFTGWIEGATLAVNGAVFVALLALIWSLNRAAKQVIAAETEGAENRASGFAGVASEVRALAERSQETAAEVARVSSRSNELAVKVGENLRRMVPDIIRIASLVQGIAEGRTVGRRMLGRSSPVLRENGGRGEQDALAAEQLAAIAVDLASGAEELEKAVAAFRLEELAAAKPPPPWGPRPVA